MRYNTKCTRHWKRGLNWTPSGRQQFVLLDGSCTFMMPLSETLLYGLEIVHEYISIAGPTQTLGSQQNFCQPFKYERFCILQKDAKGKWRKRPPPGAHSKRKLVSELLKDRRVKFAGHILRSNNIDPLRRGSMNVILRSTTMLGNEMGGPRQECLLYTSRYV